MASPKEASSSLGILNVPALQRGPRKKDDGRFYLYDQNYGDPYPRESIAPLIFYSVVVAALAITAAFIATHQ